MYINIYVHTCIGIYVHMVAKVSEILLATTYACT